LNYYVAGSNCYDCNKYGRLYDWATAMALADCNNSYTCLSYGGAIDSVKLRGICPSGWHISNVAEWETLKNFVGANAGTKLKTTSDWNPKSGIPTGTDVYGFSALSGGYYDPDNSSFNGVGGSGTWWTSSDNAYNALPRNMYNGSEDIDNYIHRKRHLVSVRCVKD